MGNVSKQKTLNYAICMPCGGLLYVVVSNYFFLLTLFTWIYLLFDCLRAVSSRITIAFVGFVGLFVLFLQPVCCTMLLLLCALRLFVRPCSNHSPPRQRACLPSGRLSGHSLFIGWHRISEQALDG